MGSRLDNIEEKIIEVLTGIDKSTHSTGYTYWTQTGTINVSDEVLSLGRNRTGATTDYKSVNHYVDQQDDFGVEGQDWTQGQKAYTNRVVYEIKSTVHNIGDESKNKLNPKNEIRKRMNELTDDLLFAFGLNDRLDGQVTWIRFLGAVKDYADITNNRIQTGTLTTRWEVIYTQSFNNPGIPACS